MKKYLGFIIALILLCAIPGIIYVVFSDPAQENIGTLPAPSLKGSTGTLEATTADYRVQVSIPRPPLKVGKQRLTLTLQPLHVGKEVAAAPEVQVTMPMGQMTMKAPVVLEKLRPPGAYSLQTEFSMAGTWLLGVKPSPASPTISLKLVAQ